MVYSQHCFTLSWLSHTFTQAWSVGVALHISAGSRKWQWQCLSPWFLSVEHWKSGDWNYMRDRIRSSNSRAQALQKTRPGYWWSAMKPPTRLLWINFLRSPHRQRCTWELATLPILPVLPPSWNILKPLKTLAIEGCEAPTSLVRLRDRPLALEEIWRKHAKAPRDHCVR